ncbi:uncharacterized protein EMH_0072540 [Eimeria mitis]|uniref:Uncharacterized protein n=1 Tax=Eimeria mitis TaxID=44415 RepID=U6K7C7_9EIME|nr:uncharacterized protein EMH_0072540 [Eimeria mitis]CDJ32117.1 hypothetical protein, conserved [Eimeria mitis]
MHVMKKQTNTNTPSVSVSGSQAQPSPSSFTLPLQAYKPFKRQPPALPLSSAAAAAATAAAPAAAAAAAAAAASPQQHLVPRCVSPLLHPPINNKAAAAAKRFNTSGYPQVHRRSRSACITPSAASSRGGPSSSKMSIHRVAAAETQGFLRAKIAAKEQLCSEVIGENQKLIRHLEETKLQHRQTVEKLKAEAAAVVQQLLADTAVYRDTNDNLLRKLHLQEQQTANDALRARQAERRSQEAEEKLFVLKR